MSNNVTEGDKDLVCESIATSIRMIAPLIEGKFLDCFTVAFQVDGRQFVLELKETFGKNSK